MSEWISVKDRLPEGSDGKSLCQNVIVCMIDKTVLTGWLNGDVWYLLQTGDDFLENL